MNWQIKKMSGYVVGFLLFYAPFAFFEKAVIFLLGGRWQEANIHKLCLRIQIEHILDGQFFTMKMPFLVSFFLLTAAAFYFGPIFCGRLCPAGAFTEYASKIIPNRAKIRWSPHIDIAAVRYGFLAGYMLAPFFHFAIACAYCNFFLFDLFVNFFLFGYIISLTSSQLLTVVVGFGLFGLFTQGGRGYCNFFCPVGSFQSLVHLWGRKLPFTKKLKLDAPGCIGCGKCQTVCPVEAMSLEEGKAKIDPCLCIICLDCQNACPQKAISYGR